MKRFLAAAACLAATVQASPFSEAVRTAPAVEAALQRAEAAGIRAGAAGRWADPELEGTYSNVESPDDAWPMWDATLRQPLPKWGERGADKARARAGYAMARAEADMTAGDVAAETAMALAEREAALRIVELLRNQIERTERAHASVEARLATGQGRISEQLALQSRLAELRLAAERETRQAENAEADARQALGLDPDEPLPAFAGPAPADVRPGMAPGLVLLDAQKDEARAMAAMARASARPMTAIGLSFEREEEDTGDTDTLGISFMTELPWNSRRYARADERAATADAASREADAETLRRRIETDVARAERLAQLAREARTAADATRQRIGLEVDALLSAAGAAGMQESSSVVMLLELLDRSTELEMQVIETETEARSAQAGLWRYQPILSGETP